MRVFPLTHRSHDYAFLMKRWQAFAKKERITMQPFANAGEHPVFFIHSRSGEAKSTNREQCIYISSGVHGDEPAAPWGLLKWAEENTALLKAHRFLIFPCLNPHGLINNTRVDQRGIDINRTFHNLKEPLIAAWHSIVEQYRPAVGLCLHEDFDGQGVYLYELNHKPDIVGHRILSDCAGILPLDLRTKIDTSKADRGLINRRRLPLHLPGMPEAIVLHQMGVPVTLTFESPSEFSLPDRIETQKRFIESALHHVVGL